MVSEIEELETFASEIHARRLNAKEVLMPKKGDRFIFPIADGTVKLSGRDQVFLKIHSSFRITLPRSARRAGRVSTIRHAVERHQANQLTDQSHREKSWVCTELEMRDRALQEDRVISEELYRS